MKLKALRTVIIVLVLAVVGVGFVAHFSFGSLCSIGWQDISVLCPIGALGTMIASKTVVPRAVIAIVIAIVAFILIGRAWCAWACPVPLVSKLRIAFKSKKAENAEKAAAQAALTDTTTELTEEEKALLKTACGSKACRPGEEPNNSRYFVLGGALLSAAIFGFPVFCLICPVGLTFALIFVLVMLFGSGEVTLSVIAIPVLLLVEVVFFRKWCSHLCPISALMSIVSKINKPLTPTVDHTKCIDCGRCAQICSIGCDPHMPKSGTNLHECIKCHECVEECPTHAISMPLIPKSKPGAGSKSKSSKKTALTAEAHLENAKD